MSGIFGMYYPDRRPVSLLDLQQMLEALGHLGPDAKKIWFEGCIGLGHLMLHTTPESLHEYLPLSDPGTGFVITADARLDNRDELIHSLELTYYPPIEISDSRLILECYKKWGDECAKKLLGDFAFAIWDARNHSLFCARDHLGIKPFYYFSSAQTFVFATQIKALFRIPCVPRYLNELMVAQYISGLFDDRTLTLYKDVLRLPPAHCLSVNDKGVKVWSYYALDPTRELRLASNEEYAEELRECFSEAVRCRLRSAFAVGSMLSGGLDSSSITCVARNLLTEAGKPKLHTFSALFGAVPKCDESQYIKAVIAQNGIVPHFFHADQFGPLNDLDRILLHLDEPITGGNFYLDWGIYRVAKETGLRVMLDGWDGDTTISHGTGLFMELARARRWITLLREARGYCKHFDGCPAWRVVLKNIENHGLHPKAKRAVRFTLRANRALKRRTLNRIRSDSQLPSRGILREEFAQSLNFYERWSTTSRRLQHKERDAHFNRMHETLIPKVLEDLHAAAGAFLIDLRFPFWDIRLMQFCLALPAEQKLSNGWNRMVMRRAMDGVLPPEIQWRGGKNNFTHGFVYGLLTHEREVINNIINQNSEAIENFVDIGALRAAYHRLQNGQASESDSSAIWRSVSVALWLRRASATV